MNVREFADSIGVKPLIIRHTEDTITPRLYQHYPVKHAVLKVIEITSETISFTFKEDIATTLIFSYKKESPFKDVVVIDALKKGLSSTDGFIIRNGTLDHVKIPEDGRIVTIYWEQCTHLDKKEWIATESARRY